jgi:hypothetical protein
MPCHDDHDDGGMAWHGNVGMPPFIGNIGDCGRRGCDAWLGRAREREEKQRRGEECLPPLPD